MKLSRSCPNHWDEVKDKALGKKHQRQHGKVVRNSSTVLSTSWLPWGGSKYLSRRGAWPNGGTKLKNTSTSNRHLLKPRQRTDFDIPAILIASCEQAQATADDLSIWMLFVSPTFRPGTHSTCGFVVVLDPGRLLNLTCVSLVSVGVDTLKKKHGFAGPCFSFWF